MIELSGFSDLIHKPRTKHELKTIHKRVKLRKYNNPGTIVQIKWDLCYHLCGFVLVHSYVMLLQALSGIASQYTFLIHYIYLDVYIC